MKLLVIRHGRAENAGDFAKTGASDDLRPLTGDGRERMRLAAAGLHSVVDEIDVLASSPLVRARETADIIAAEFGAPDVTELDELRPGTAPSALVDWLEGAGEQETIAVVGHDTHVSELVGLLLSGRAEAIVEVKKGAALLLELSKGRGPGSARLLWSLTPKQLRALASSDSGPEASAHAQRPEQ